MADGDLDWQPAAWQTVTEPGAVRALTDAAARRTLIPFLGRENTVATAARELGVSGNRLLYFVTKLCRLGLLRLTRVQPRAGKPIKLYQATADGFFVPFSATPADTLETLLLPTHREWDALFVREAARTVAALGPEVGLRLWRGPTGELYVKPGPPPPQPVDASLLAQVPVLSIWTAELWLSPADVNELHARLLALFDDFSTRHGAQRHLLHLGLTPHQNK